MNQADKPPITCDTLQKFPGGRAARVEQRPLGPDIESFLLRGVSGSGASTPSTYGRARFCCGITNDSGEAVVTRRYHTHLPREERRLLDNCRLDDLLAGEHTPRHGIDRVFQRVGLEVALRRYQRPRPNSHRRASASISSRLGNTAMTPGTTCAGGGGG
jgi:hypothetical protein